MQTCVLQAWLWLVAPEQRAPPYCGAGLEQLRVRTWVPPPHVTVQVPHDPQFEKPPSTVTYIITFINLNFFWNENHFFYIYLKDWFRYFDHKVSYLDSSVYYSPDWMSLTLYNPVHHTEGRDQNSFESASVYLPRRSMCKIPTKPRHSNFH